MVKKIGPHTAIVSSKELGSKCWSPKRFVEGGRCDRVMVCNYPEKKDCEAVSAEVAFLYQEVDKTRIAAEKRVAKLMEEAENLRIQHR